MCGICGIYNFDGNTLNPRLIETMVASMPHRGPDDRGFFFDEKSFKMGMCRLSIIDLEFGKQPIYSEDKRYCVILNGEIYNYIELREDLAARGHHFSTRSDTEVIVHLFEEYGERGVNYLNGIFAFALWDAYEKVLYVFRDRLGVKPFFYAWHERQFIFSSDLTSLRKIFYQREIDRDALLLYLTLAYVPYPYTIFRSIKKLPPATYIKLTKDGNLKIVKYWQLPEQEADEKGIDEYAKFIKDALRKSIRLQLRSDVSVGTFLSGGLDSSSVVALLSELGVKGIKTFSLGFDGGLNELPFARLIAERFRTDHFEAVLRAEEVPGIIDELIPFLDEPIADNSIVPTFVLSRAAREKGVKVILNGTGGDEVFGGYTRYERHFLRTFLLHCPLSLRNLGSKILSFNQDKLVKIKNPEVMFLSSGVNFSFLHQNLKEWEDYQRAILLATEHLYSRIDHPSQKREIMRFDLRSYLIDDILSLLDKMTMAHSIEGRVPFLDHELVEKAYRIPTKIIFCDGILKGLLRRSVADILPRQLYHQPKRGFSGPTEYWVNGPLRDSLVSVLVENPISFLGDFIDLKSLKKTMEEEINPRFCESLFSLYIFTLWYKKHNI